jgi:creatinine amidohydrolase/Fe(II)-dependent formamide hydrolase-like protein
VKQIREFARWLLAGLVLVFVTAPAIGGQGLGQEDPAERARRLMAEPDPLAPSASVWIEELTYMEVRDRIAAGATTAIVPTGGIEENGPYLATGKHNYILEAMCPVIVGKLGNALCAPIVPFVPEGNIDPPSGLMYFPGTFSVRDETFVALLEDIGASLKQHGFRNIVFIGDSGGNQRGMQAAAESLNEKWRGSGVRAHFVGEFYTPGWEETEQYTKDVLGVKEGKSDGHHDDIWVTAMMMVTDPESVRYEQRVDAGLASINGVDISDLDKTVELGRKMIDFRAGYTVEAIRKHIAGE